jgi:hypothetical protein
VTGVVHARVEERHRSREFVDLLKQILAQIDRINRNPVVHKWTYKLKGVA